MSVTKLNISKHTNAIMRQLHIEPTMVRSLHIEPGTIQAEVYVPNSNGAKHMVNGEVQTTIRRWEVRT